MSENFKIVQIHFNVISLYVENLFYWKTWLPAGRRLGPTIRKQ